MSDKLDLLKEDVDSAYDAVHKAQYVAGLLAAQYIREILADNGVREGQMCVITDEKGKEHTGVFLVELVELDENSDGVLACASFYADTTYTNELGYFYTEVTSPNKDLPFSAGGGPCNVGVYITAVHNITNDSDS